MVKETLKVPQDYVPGYERARRIDLELADNYIAHTHMGDPMADALIEALSTLSRTEAYPVHRGRGEPGRGGVERRAPGGAGFQSRRWSNCLTGSIGETLLRAFSASTEGQT